MTELISQIEALIVRHWEVLYSLLIVVGLAIYAAASHSLHQRRHPAAAIAWVLGIVLLPYVALPLYLAFGSRKIVAKRAARGVRRVAAVAPTPPATAARAQQLGMAMGLPDPVAYEGLSIHEDGTQALNALRCMIDGAKRTLEISTFVLGAMFSATRLLNGSSRPHRHLSGRLPGFGRLRAGRCGSGSVRSAVALAQTRTYQSAQPPQDGHRGWHALVVRRKKSCSRVFRRRSSSDSWP